MGTVKLLPEFEEFIERYIDLENYREGRVNFSDLDWKIYLLSLTDFDQEVTVQDQYHAFLKKHKLSGSYQYLVNNKVWFLTWQQPIDIVVE